MKKYSEFFAISSIIRWNFKIVFIIWEVECLAKAKIFVILSSLDFMSLVNSSPTLLDSHLAKLKMLSYKFFVLQLHGLLWMTEWPAGPLTERPVGLYLKNQLKDQLVPNWKTSWRTSLSLAERLAVHERRTSWSLTERSPGPQLKDHLVPHWKTSWCLTQKPVEVLAGP